MQSLLCARAVVCVTWTVGFDGTLQSCDPGHCPQLCLRWLSGPRLPGRPTPSCSSRSPAHPCALQTRLVAQCARRGSAVPFALCQELRAGADRAYSRPAHFRGLPGFTEQVWPFQPGTGSGRLSLSFLSPAYPFLHRPAGPRDATW